MRKIHWLAFLVTLAATAHAQKFTTDAFMNLNSAFDDQNPVISPDGKTLYLTIANHPGNVGAKKDPGDIWVSSWENNTWSAPVHAGAIINDKNYNAVAGFSMDGKNIFLFNHYEKGGQPATTQGISVATRTTAGWSAPESINIPYFLNKSEFISGQLSNDGTVLIYSAEAYNSKGAEDLYVTIKNSGGSWSEPRNMGPVINTAFQELSPAISADKKMIYFSSNGRRGYGSFDVYYAERLDDTWANWSIPVNMGSRVNSEGRELYFRSYPQMSAALFTSTRNSDGYGDIRVYTDSISTKLPDTVIRMVEIRRENFSKTPDKFTTIRGTVSNSKTGQPVAASLVFKSDSTQKTTSGKQGLYSIQITSTKVYSIVIEAEGYVGALEKLDIHTFEMKQIELNFKLQPIEVGATVNLKNVLFQVQSTTMLSESYDELNVVVDLLKSNPKIEIELRGHTDTRGDAKLNLKLSQSRVDKVKAYLVSKGISGKRIQGKGYGGKKPIANSDSEENRRLNRRVEFTILKD